jgi:glutaminyl-tRNA synthetase
MAERNDFIRDIIDADLAAGRHDHVATRFPPEPNGYLHIGHAKSICLNFGLAQDYRGTCNLRYDDTNPTKEEVEYVEAIERDVRWLGFAPTAVLYASDFFLQMYDLAEKLVRDGKAYVCDLTEEQIREYRGSLSEPGRPSPGRERSVEENLDLFRRMRAGELPDGACVLRARIDMAAANMKMRDPLLYRIRHATHHRTGDAWCIYPMYDYAHPLEDAFEQITHSICTLEFENNRELYDWVIEATGVSPRPRQYEFARLSLDYTVMSKRKLLELVQSGAVSGWDDPRMPTIAGMRRRGYRPEAIRAFCDMIGVAKNNSTVDIGKLEYCVRDDLNRTAPRAMAVLRPLRVVLSNVSGAESLRAPLFPPDVGLPGARELPFEAELLIERDDFQLEPEPGYLRLAPGRTVRLRHGPCITCDEVVRDAAGAVIELRGRVLDDTRGGKNPEGVKVWGVIHWLAAARAVPAEVRLYDRLFSVARPDDGGDFASHLSAGSLEVVTGAFVEPSLATAAVGHRVQFERLGYFAVDTGSRPGALVWNRVVGLREAVVEAAAASAPAASPAPAKEKDKDKTRPARRSRAEYRAEARNRDAGLAERHARFQAELGLGADEADLLTGDRDSADLFEATVAAGAPAREAARLIINELPRAVGERPLAELPFGGVELAALVALASEGKLAGPAQKEVLAELAQRGGDPRALVAERGLTPLTDDAAVEALVERAISDHADKAAAYRAGRSGLMGFFVGAVVKASNGRANPQKVKDLLEKRLAAG